MVKVGDLILELDPQDQVRSAMDRRAELIDLDDQIQKKRSDQAVAKAADDTAMTVAEHDLARARLDMLSNDLLAKVKVETNTLALEQAQAKLSQLKSTVALKQKAADADVRILEIRRERSERALKYAENNVTLMAVRATFAGIVVLKTTYKGSTQSEIAAGDEVRPGLAVMDVIDPQAMQVRAKVNQADIGLVTQGQSATVRLDAYPELSFTGHVELIAPLGIPSNMTPSVRNFVVLVPIKGTHPRLMPDLTASVDLGSPASQTGPASLESSKSPESPKSPKSPASPASPKSAGGQR
jgi:multidrug resistance efflux pump